MPHLAHVLPKMLLFLDLAVMGILQRGIDGGPDHDHHPGQIQPDHQHDKRPNRFIRRNVMGKNHRVIGKDPGKSHP